MFLFYKPPSVASWFSDLKIRQRLSELENQLISWICSKAAVSKLWLLLAWIGLNFT